MELRIDLLLNKLRQNTAELLERIDRDPLLIKRQSGDLILANAGKLLFSPTEEHHLFAKGIVYRREPFELVSLPLIKIYNLGEKEVTTGQLTPLLSEEALGPARLHFLCKYDGSLIQRFQSNGRVMLTTRGMIEGAFLPDWEPADDDTPKTYFDYLGTARKLAAARYPAILEAVPAFSGLTFLFELIHPEARIITDYGEREDLILLAVFDRNEWRYWTFAEVRALAQSHGWATVETYAPTGATVSEQIESLLNSIAGTDHEGSVLTFEQGSNVVYRVKVKSPDYLRLLRLMVDCTYSATVEMLDSFADFPSWEQFRAFLESKGAEKVPEEVLAEYQRHYDRFAAYRIECESIRQHAAAQCEQFIVELGPSEDVRQRRKAFAQRVLSLPQKSLLFSAYDRRLNLRSVRDLVPNPQEATELLNQMLQRASE